MRLCISLALAAACAMAGCASYEPQMDRLIEQWTQPRYSSTLSDEQAQALSAELAGLRARREQVRAKYASESDSEERMRQYRELHAIGLAVSPIETQLAKAGRSLR